MTRHSEVKQRTSSRAQARTHRRTVGKERTASTERTTPAVRRASSRTQTVADILEDYARRGVFRGFSRGPDRRAQAGFKVVWHRNSIFDLVYDPKNNSLGCSCLLPSVPANSSMYRELKQFIKQRFSDDLPDHRRIDRRLATAAISNRRGSVSLALTGNGGDCEYVTRKLIHLMHEVFMTFLLDGKYFDYVVETFNLDPDSM